MGTTPGFLRYVLRALQGLAAGSLDEVDLASRGYDGPDEAEILTALRQLHQNLERTLAQADTIARGNYAMEIATHGEKDLLGTALGKMTATLRDIAAVAASISAGDYSVRVQVKGDKDELARAVNEMVANLQGLTARYEDEVWLKTGQAQLADVMRGDTDIAALCKSVATLLATRLGAQVGLVFVADEEGRLRPSAGYASPRPERLPQQLLPGEGLVGEAALQQRLLQVSDVPETYLPVSSGLGQAVPRHLVAVPCPFEGQVRAVVELGLLKAPSNRDLVFLGLAAERIAAAISAVDNRQRLVHLLEETQSQAEELQAQSEELQAQQEELRASNEELEEQTQRLLASEENLRAQAEELQASNEELEETTQRLERQKTEAQARNLELEAARASLDRQAQALAQASQYKSQFLANMSHELRTPLNSLLILSGSLSQNDDGNLTPRQVESARVIHSSGKDLLELINDILDLSKVEAGRLHVELEDVAIAEMAYRLRTQFAPLATSKGLALDVVIDSDLPASFRTDSQRTEQILKNLLANACKFTSRGRITLRFRRPDPDVASLGPGWAPDTAIGIAVSDTGIGIPQANRDEVFEAFHQGDGSTSRRYGGTGLGLAISRELSRALGGAIHLESTEGQGSTFTLYLPLAGAASVGGAAVQRREPAEPGDPPPAPVLAAAFDEHRTALRREAPGGLGKTACAEAIDTATGQRAVSPSNGEEHRIRGRKILLVDDDPRNTFALSAVLEDAGLEVVIADNGRLALEKLDAEPGIELVVMDIMMPVMDGLEAIRAIRDQRRFRRLPILAVTAKAMPEDRARSLEAGANDYLTKPVDVERLLSLTQVWLSAEEPATE